MDFRIPEELEILRITLRKFFQNEVEPLIGEIEKNDEVPEELIKKVAELGYCGLNIPEEYGGQEMGVLAQCLAYEEFSPHMGFLMRISPALTCEAIVGDGTEEQKKKYLPDIAKGKIVTAIAITEPNAGSDIGAITTSAIRDGDNFILNGRKHFISNGDIADLVMVMVLTDKKLGIRGRITATLVGKGTPGFSVGRIQETMGLAGSHQSELIFEDCVVSAKNVVGKEGDGYRLIMKYLDRGRLYTGVAALGIAEKALRLSIEYSNQRVQFGRPISQNQAIQWMLADSATEIYAARMMIYNGIWKAEQGMNFSTESAMIKVFATEMAGRVVDRAVQIFGGMGYMKELPIEGLYRDIRFSRIAEGTSEIQRVIIASRLLKGDSLL